MAIGIIHHDEIIIKTLFTKEKYKIRPNSFEINLSYYRYETIDEKTNAYIVNVRKLKWFDEISVKPIIESE